MADESGKTKKDVPASGEAEEKKKAGKTEVATLGAGCFWCIEAVLEQIEGVGSVVSGYMGGHVKNPTYEQICTKKTGHIEVVQVTFDPEKLSFDDLLGYFWKLHDPTSMDKQGADEGPQYRSAIFYHSDEQKKASEAAIKKVDASKVLGRPIVTVVRKLETFYTAEGYHQDFYRLNKRHPYCRAVIVPKLEKLNLEK
ncbi:MAG: peptide-methionine (S)-S-oxide reductase MsrA [Verrucomicrobiota bacterium]